MDQENNSQGEAVPQGLDRALRYVLYVSAFLAPLFILSPVSISFAKGIFITVTTLLLVVLWALKVLRVGQFQFPKSWFVVSMLLLALVYTLSAFLSDAPMVSFVGQFEVGTAVSMLLLIVLALVSSATLERKRDVFFLLLSLIASMLVLALHEIIRLFVGPGVLSFGVLGSVSETLIGKWNDLAIFFGLGSVLSLIALESTAVRGYLRVGMWVTLIVSLFYLALTQFTFVWVVVGLLALTSVIYAFAFKRELDVHTSPDHGRRMPNVAIPSLIVLAAAIIFLIPGGGSSVSRYFAERFNIQQLELRPNWTSTVHIAKESLSKNPILGVGPNRFINEWLRFKPSIVNQDIFWSVDFNSGYGLIPTFVVTTGLVGALSWIFFLALYLYIGARSIVAPVRDSFSRYLLVSSFFGSLYLWFFSLVYVPGHTIMYLSFLLTGSFLAVLQLEKSVEGRIIRYAEDPKTNFATVLVLIMCIVCAAAGGFFLTQKFAAGASLARGVRAYNVDNNLHTSEARIRRAIELDPSEDLYYRSLDDVLLLRLGGIVNDETIPDVERRDLFQNLLSEALTVGQEAIRIDGTDYQNWINLGRIYEFLIPVGIEGSYQAARNAYEEAGLRNPLSPAIYLFLARIEMQNKNSARARQMITKALELKSNYTDAVFLLSQVEARDNNLDGAIRSAEAAASLAPNEPVVFFQLGLMRYSDRNFRGAIEAFERAIALNADYANARYFLGLSYHELGRVEDAIAQFLAIEKTNPNNTEVALIIQNLSEGKPPFSGAAAPITESPERRETPPIDER